MYKLIEQYFAGKLSAEEKQSLFAKINSDDKWKKEFIAKQNLHGLTAWVSDTKILQAKKRKRKKHIIETSLKHFTGYAASALIILTISWFVKVYTQTHDENTKSHNANEILYQEFSTPPGQRAFIRLQDNTTVWLNAQTRLRYPVNFSEKERRVELDGEAFFDVFENKETPFIISTKNFNIKVTGTSLNVYAYKKLNEFVTSLTEGSVEIYENKKKTPLIHLKPNERAELINGKLTKTGFSNMDFLLWKDGIYAFDDVSFAEVLRKLELYYGVSVIVKNNSINHYRFSGKLRQNDGLEKVLQALQKIQKFSFTKDNENNIIIQ